MDTKKNFDAVAESRKWRSATGKKLSAMTEEQRLAYLNHGITYKLQALREDTIASKSRRQRKISRKRTAHA
jgi:hypothetical protein